mmetsp:Transcript_16625/g.35123  ORF Transcript_16625/g.35123 Transcript_16625/m.35123 type:complete len:244 (+) Transcript_16625:1886-2617(+)
MRISEASNGFKAAQKCWRSISLSPARSRRSNCSAVRGWWRSACCWSYSLACWCWRWACAGASEEHEAPLSSGWCASSAAGLCNGAGIPVGRGFNKRLSSAKGGCCNGSGGSAGRRTTLPEELPTSRHPCSCTHFVMKHSCCRNCRSSAASSFCSNNAHSLCTTLFTASRCVSAPTSAVCEAFLPASSVALPGLSVVTQPNGLGLAGTTEATEPGPLLPSAAWLCHISCEGDPQGCQGQDALRR